MHVVLNYNHITFTKSPKTFRTLVFPEDFLVKIKKKPSGYKQKNNQKNPHIKLQFQLLGHMNTQS